jgi:DNA-binding NarL/FixJ family response regulator
MYEQSVGATMVGMPRTVLIVDDHSDFRRSARRLLESEGFAIVGDAATAQQAVDLARALEPDIVLLDIQLPDHDGFWVADELAALAWKPAVVLISSRAAAASGDRLATVPARGFIAKGALSGATLAALVE